MEEEGGRRKEEGGTRKEVRWGTMTISENAYDSREIHQESSENREVGLGKNKKQQEARKHCKNCGFGTTQNSKRFGGD